MAMKFLSATVGAFGICLTAFSALLLSSGITLGSCNLICDDTCVGGTGACGTRSCAYLSSGCGACACFVNSAGTGCSCK